MSVNENALEIGEISQVAVLSTTAPNGAVTRPLYGQAQGDGSVALEVAIVSGGGSGSSNTVAATNAGTTATTANPIQGVTNGVPVPVGPVGGKTATVLVTPTVSTSAYVAGYVVGGLLTFSNALLSAQSGILQSIKVSCKSVQTAGFKLYIFTSNPTNSTWTDHAAPAINAADIPYLVDIVSLSAPDSGLGTHTLYAFDGIGRALNAASTSLYGILVTTGTPTFASTSDVSVAINVLQD